MSSRRIFPLSLREPTTNGRPPAVGNAGRRGRRYRAGVRGVTLAVFPLSLRERAGVRGVTLAVLLSALSATALSAAPAPVAEILGEWHGTSTCVKSPEFPSCHDEVVVYEFRKAAAGGDTVTLAAYKIVDGEKLLMGEMDFSYDEKQGAWASEFRSPRYHGLWTFFVKQGAITGTLVDLPSKHVVRNVSVRREKPAPR